MELKGKTINFLGDSITEGVGVSDIKAGRYDNRLKEMLELKAVNNYGVSGTRIAHQSAPSEKPRYDLCFCGRAYDMEKGADIIIVYGGVNDYIHGDAYFGQLTDKTPATFCGGVDFLMRLLKSEYPNAKIVFMTPAHMQYNDLYDTKASDRPTKKSDAKPLYEYVKAIIAKGEEHGIPVLNLYDNLEIDPNNSVQKAEYTADGLHFNDKGHEVLALRIAEFLKSLQ